MSPMIASASENSPPAPRPWTARNAASMYIDVANAQAAEPMRKMEIAVRKRGLRPYSRREDYGPASPRLPFERGTDGPRVIMVGVDGSEAAQRAGAYAGGLARRQHAHLVVVFVAAPSVWSAAVAPGLILAQEDSLRERATRLLRTGRWPVVVVP